MTPFTKGPGFRPVYWTCSAQAHVAHLLVMCLRCLHWIFVNPSSWFSGSTTFYPPVLLSTSTMTVRYGLLLITCSYSTEHVSSERYWLELWILYSWCMEDMQACDIQTTIGSGDDNHDHCSHIYNAWHINLIHGNTIKKPTLLSHAEEYRFLVKIHHYCTIMEVQLSFQL